MQKRLAYLKTKHPKAGKLEPSLILNQSSQSIRGAFNENSATHAQDVMSQFSVSNEPSTTPQILTQNKRRTSLMQIDKPLNRKRLTNLSVMKGARKE